MTAIWTVDAFTEQPYRGNPAGVMIVGEFPTDEICAAIAAEMNLSETAFVKPLATGHYHLRWFTPKTEIRLCSHATLASAHILFTEENIGGAHVRFDTLSGALHVSRADRGYVMDFPLQKVDASVDPAPFAAALPPGIKILAAMRAVDDVIVEIADEAQLRAMNPDITQIVQLDCRGLIVTAAGQAPYDCVSRFFAPRVGIPEDPVTGSAHCKLADYWSRKFRKQELRAYQASARGGAMGLTVKGDRVLLKGAAVTVMEGRWRIAPDVRLSAAV